MIKVNKKIISTGIGVIAGAIGGKVLTSKLAKKGCCGYSPTRIESKKCC